MNNRLIKGVSLSTNIESNFISKLKQESGITYVSKMAGMITDLEKSKKEIDSYKQSDSKGIPNGIKFNIQIISKDAWEVSKIYMEAIELPKFLSSCIKDFETFYLKRNSGQKLIWCLGLS
jgi:cullin 3